VASTAPAAQAAGQASQPDSHTKPARTAACSWDGKHMASGSDDQTAVVWDATTGQPQKKLEHPCAVVPVTWSRDGKWLATGGLDRLVRIWDTAQY
jgi:WD40 repeat protein